MKNNRGITLIALVVTIIVLIILAGISVNLLLGQNGLLQRAKDAASQQERAELVEGMKLAIANKQVETRGVLTQADIEEVLGAYGTVENGSVTTTKGGHVIAITDVYNGTIEPPPTPTKNLSSITITTQPTKTSYVVGENLDLTGIVVTATYSDETTSTVTAGVTFSPVNGTTLSTAGTTTITASYTEGETTKTETTTVTVKRVYTPRLCTADENMQYREYTSNFKVVKFQIEENEQITSITNLLEHISDGETRDIMMNEEWYWLDPYTQTIKEEYPYPYIHDVNDMIVLISKNIWDIISDEGPAD